MVKSAWKPGQSGNPNGRPRDALKDAIQAALAETVSVPGDDGKTLKISRNDAIIRVAWKMAEGGNVKAMELLWERGYGKAVQPMDIEGRLEHVPAIQIEVVAAKRDEGTGLDK